MWAVFSIVALGLYFSTFPVFQTLAAMLLLLVFMLLQVLVRPYEFDRKCGLGLVFGRVSCLDCKMRQLARANIAEEKRSGNPV